MTLTLGRLRYFANRKRPRGWVGTTPWIFAFPSEFFENISHGYVFGVKESNGDNEKNSIFIAWPWKSRSNTLLHDLSYLRLQTWYKLDLGVDSKIFEVEDIKNVEKNYVTLTGDLGTQGHTHSLYDLS